MFEDFKFDFNPQKPRSESLSDELLRDKLTTVEKQQDYGHLVLESGKFIHREFRHLYEDDHRTHYRPNFYEVETQRGTELVDMDTHGEVIATADDEQRIATFGLGGCTAVAVAAEYADGMRRGYIQHYSPLNKLTSADVLAQEAASIEFPNEPVHTRAVIMTPGRWSADPSLKHGMEPKDDILTNLLVATTRASVGFDADVQVLPYSEVEELGRYGQGTLMIEFTPDGDTVITAQNLVIKPAG